MNNKTEQIFILSTSNNQTPSTSQKSPDGHQANSESKYEVHRIPNTDI